MSSSVEISIPQELSQQVHSGNVVLFVGAGLSIGAGLPSWDALIRPLAEHIGYTGGDWLKAAQYYENQSGRNALISYLRDRLNTTGITPTENHTLLTRLPVNIVFTTNLDDLLEWAYRSAGRRVNLVVGATGLTMWDESQVNLVKLHGTYDRPETFIITEKDYNTFYRHNALLVQQLGALLATKTFLFAGYSVSDPDFNQLYDQLGVDLGRYQRRPYLVTFDVDPFKAKDLEQRGYCVINLPGEGDRNARLGEWLGALLKAVAAPGPEATSRLPQAAVPPPLPFQPPAMPPSSPQPIATPPSSSTPSVQIVTPEGLKLTKQQRDILQHVYQDFRQVIVEAELVGGLGGACVLLVVPVAKDDRPAARRVVKLGYALELRRERNRYKQYVEPVLPMRVTQVESERYYEQGDQAGLSYIFVGGSVFGDAVDLDQYYRRSFPQAVKKLHRTLNVLLDKNLG
jgi:hypothetical protein